VLPCPSFNTTGPCVPGEHYMLPPERRLGDVLAQIDDHRFFPLHPGRKTGKATSLMWLEDHLNGVGRCRAVWVDLEMAREQPDVARAMTAVLDVIDRALAQRHPEIPRPEPAESGAMLTRPEPALLASLQRLASLEPRPRCSCSTRPTASWTRRWSRSSPSSATATSSAAACRSRRRRAGRSAAGSRLCVPAGGSM